MTTTTTNTTTTNPTTTTTSTTDHALTASEPQHVAPPPDYEALLTGVVALAADFSNCVEAFGLIHPMLKWEKGEQRLLTRVGLQQARLLVWGDIVGVSSPPASVTDRAVPKHPSAAYPDLKEPTFFNARDERLEDTQIRTQVEAALSAIVERQSNTSREEMMHQYGLKPPKKFTPQYEHALDVNRLEAFREKHELLKEVAETYAQISTRRASSITRTSWSIADPSKFEGYIKLIQSKIDTLIDLMDVRERLDRGIRMDIKALGWHLSPDRQRIAADTSKLRLLTEVCKEEYPEYIPAIETALANIDRERRESIIDYNPYANAGAIQATTTNASTSQAPRRGSIGLVQTADLSNGSSPVATNGAAKPKHSSGLLGGFFKFGKKSSTPAKPSSLNPPRSQSVSAIPPKSPTEDLTPRALSDAGPGPSGPGLPSPPHTTSDQADPLAQPPVNNDGMDDDLGPNDLPPARSKSVGEILELQPETEEEKDLLLQHKLERMDTNATVEDDIKEGAESNGGEVKFGLVNAPSRHDQFHGLGRQGTKVQWD